MSSKPEPAQLKCTSCGAPVDVRLPGKTQSYACSYCNTILDTTSDELKIIQKFKKQKRINPIIELGARGKFEGQEFEFVGFLRKQDNYGGSWDEYLLFNPYLGFRYLTCWQGHWNYIILLKGFPFYKSGKPVLPSGQGGFAYKNHRKYQFFFSYTAKVKYVLGEFNWKVRTTDEVKVSEYINPPWSISGEESGNEIVWAEQQYVEPSFIKKAFNLKKNLPTPSLVAPNQPNPFKFRWKVAVAVTFLCTIISLVGAGMVDNTAENKVIFTKQYNIDLTGTEIKRSQGTFYREFQLTIGNIEITKGPERENKNLEINILTNVDNSWAYLTFFLMNEKTRKGYRYAEEISYYRGYTDGENWTEGSTRGSITTELLDPGNYYVIALGQTNRKHSIKIKLQITRDVPPWGFLMFFLLCLWLGPVPYYMYRSWRMESIRNA